MVEREGWAFLPPRLRALQRPPSEGNGVHKPECRGNGKYSAWKSWHERRKCIRKGREREKEERTTV